MKFSRDNIGLRPPRTRYKLDRNKVEGVALHWPGMRTACNSPLGVFRLLRAWQDQHMDTDQLQPGGASDIAYQIAVDQAGNWYQLRGLRHRSGANGDDDVNQRFGAFLLVVAEGEMPSAAMCATVRNRIARFAHIFPNSTHVVGHTEIRPEPTACPGPAVLDLIHRGVFTPKGIK